MLSNPNLWYKTSSSGGRIEDSPIIGEWTGISYTGFDTAEVMYAQADVGGLIHGTVAAANTYPTRVVVALRSSPPGESQHGFDEVLFWEENEIVDLNVEVPPSPGQWVVIGVGYPWGEAPDSMDGSYGRLISVVPTEPPPPPVIEAFATVRITVGGTCEDLAADTVLHSAELDPDRESFNCECEDGGRNVDTLCNLRERMIRRRGFVDPPADWAPRTRADLRTDLTRRRGPAASVDRPPPGMTELLNQIIAESEQVLWNRLELDRGSEAVPPRMTEDADTTTLSATLVFSHALGVAKAHYGKQDSELYLQQAERQLSDYVRQSPAGIRGTVDDFL